MNEAQLRLAAAHFSVLDDPRLPRGLNHPLVNIVIIALCAVLSDADSFYDIEDFGRLKRTWLSSFLDLSQGIPSHDTFGRTFARLDPHQFQSCVLDWIRVVLGGSLTPEDVLAIDGKTLRGSAREDVKAIHMLNVWSHRQGLCLMSTAVAGKGNEITALPSLLDTLSVLELAGCIVTVDAMGTQRQVARQLVSLKAHYVMALKANHKYLHEDVTWLFEQTYAFDDVFETRERGHGREEIRRCELLSDVSYLDPHGWPGLCSVARVTYQRTVKTHTSVETRIFLSSLNADAQTHLHAVRTHWEVENKLHWTLDVVLGEDGHTYAQDHGPENMAVLRQLALNLLNRDPSTQPLKRKRKQAALSDDYRSSLLARLAFP